MWPAPSSHERAHEMKAMTRVMGAVKVVAGLGMFAAMFTLSGPLVLLAPLCGLGAGLNIAHGLTQLASGATDD